jgi:hypothetical protein
VYKIGQLEFLRVPFESATEKANLTLLATIEDTVGSSNQCAQARYITSLQFGGAWIGNHKLEVSMHKGEMVVSRGGSRVKPSPHVRHIGKMLKLHMPDVDQLHVSSGQMSIDVFRDSRPVHFFLNVGARSLMALECKIGGLLGEDDHAAVSTPPSWCHKNANLSQLELVTKHKVGSIASASLTQ